MHKSHGIAIPYPDPKPDEDVNYKLAYAKPSNINVVGSYPLKTLTKTDMQMAVDMVVTMPPAMFQEKDYLNYRYFYKRAYYLACLAVGLQDANEGALGLKFAYLNGNDLQPIIVISPGKRKNFQ